DRLERSKVTEQRALAMRTNAGDFLQSSLPDIQPAAGAVRADRKSVSFIAQALDEIKHRIAWRQSKRRAAWLMERLTSSVAIGALGDCDQRDFVDAEGGESCACGGQLAFAAVDDDEVRPRRQRVLVRRRCGGRIRRRFVDQTL